MFRLFRALKNNGILYVSFKYGDCERQKDGRHFTDINEARLNELIDKLKSVSLDLVWITVDKRPSRNDLWLNALFVKK